MKFVGREKEQKIIERLLNSDTYQGCLVCGRRRMGKTFLLKHCLKDINKPVIFFQCKDTNEEDNTLLLSELVSEVVGIKDLSFKSFMKAIEFVFKYSLTQEIVLVIDEYPYIRNLIEGCDSYLQEIIDNYCNDAHIKFFICGSSISIMEDVMAGHNPLYLRFNQSLLLKQMDYYDSSLFYPNYSNTDKVMLYSALGGVPYYNAQVDTKLSVKENIIKIISGQYAHLEEYLDIYLRAELRKVNNAYAVFNAIACGAFHYSDILSKSRIGVSAALTTILQKLIKMDLIEYVAPINEKTNKQKAGYRISDNSIKFYFKFIYRYYSTHNILEDDVFYDKYIQNEFESSFIPTCFEDITKEYLIRQNKKGLLNPVLTDIGSYWYDNPTNHTNGQFDVVGNSDDGYVFFECKYKNEPVNDEVIKEEIEQIEKTNMKVKQYGFISKTGFKLKKEYPYIFITLDDIYK